MHKKNNVYSIILIFAAIVIVFLTVLSIFFYSTVQLMADSSRALSEEHEKLENAFEDYKLKTEAQILRNLDTISGLEQENSALSREKSRLEGELSKVSSSLSDLSKTNEQIKEEMKETLKKLDEYGQELQESQAWFSSNSMFEDEDVKEDVTFYLDRQCFVARKDLCVVKTGCLFLINLSRVP